eukprot:11184050-Lingulodinium_polyedra.AAC.1
MAAICKAERCATAPASAEHLLDVSDDATLAALPFGFGARAAVPPFATFLSARARAVARVLPP